MTLLKAFCLADAQIAKDRFNDPRSRIISSAKIRGKLGVYKAAHLDKNEEKRHGLSDTTT